ncbi:AbrB/MazE/SpoVT family DNA-binding domain-containing protein [Methylophilus sp. 5]|uniref:AbrB/MazE/SpoVT family DNA-binding domain-containing protein n=1 Tax=Methylophilus sp. 5 TaxID=1112274 RepID=UPI00048E2B5F|nr:AbrB/MazE/SpoVT family DNA-binding domain-containing protein [Methylophilus sp. 5]
MRVQKWGNSLAVKLPHNFVQAFEIKEGDDISLCVAGERSSDDIKQEHAKELLMRLRVFRGRLPESFRFDRVEANLHCAKLADNQK